MKQYSQFIESIARLYSEGRITKFVLEKLKKDGKITDEEYQFILDYKKIGKAGDYHLYDFS